MSSRRRSTVLFGVVVTLLMLVGAVVVALMLASVGAPGALILGVVLAALPLGPVLTCFLWLDRYEPEPKRLLVLALAWGAVVATSLALLVQMVDAWLYARPTTMSAALVAPFTEEFTKGLFVVLLVWARRHEFDGVLDGIVYAGFVGVGFAFTENILYLSAAYLGGEEFGPGGLGPAIGLFVLRGIFSPFAHPLFTAFIGIGAGIAVRSPRAGVRVLAIAGGYAAAVAAHALWNGSAVLAGGSGFVSAYLLIMVPGFLLMTAFAVWARSREGRMLSRALTDAAQRGLLDPRELVWLVRLDARRASRRYAARTGGRVARDALREYQQLATELGFLHDRYLRGCAPPDIAERGQRLLADMRRLRPMFTLPAPGPVPGARLMEPRP